MYPVLASFEPVSVALDLYHEQVIDSYTHAGVYTLPHPQNHFIKHSSSSTHFLGRYGPSSVLHTYFLTHRTTSSSTQPTSSATKTLPRQFTHTSSPNSDHTLCMTHVQDEHCAGCTCLLTHRGYVPRTLMIINMTACTHISCMMLHKLCLSIDTVTRT